MIDRIIEQLYKAALLFGRREMKSLNELPDLIGLNENQADAKLAADDMFVRVARQDGQDFMLTADFRTNRVNVVVVNGKITEVMDIG